MTDFGNQDAYVASMKGVILGIFSDAKIVDLTHEIAPQNVSHGSFVLQAAYPYFPTGSLFVNVVDPGVGSARNILAAKTERGIFLAPDNGLLGPILEKFTHCELRTVTNKKFFLWPQSATFHGRDCFAPTAANLAKNWNQFYLVGPRIHRYQKLDLPTVQRKSGKVRGEILYFDHFGNAFTNIAKDGISPARMADSEVRVGNKKIGKIQKSYFEVPKGKAVAIFSSIGLLEIAVNHGSARESLKLREGTTVELSS